jgi:molecular chaperone IbpA
MTKQPLDLQSLFRGTVGFDQLGDLLGQALSREAQSPNYPPYNIERLDADDYRITMALAGFSLEELTIEQENTHLTVSGKRPEADETESKSVFLHHGISNRPFQRTFQLAEYVKVTGATLENGLLSIALSRKVPKVARPRNIKIN